MCHWGCSAAQCPHRHLRLGTSWGTHRLCSARSSGPPGCPVARCYSELSTPRGSHPLDNAQGCPVARYPREVPPGARCRWGCPGARHTGGCSPAQHYLGARCCRGCPGARSHGEVLPVSVSPTGARWPGGRQPRPPPEPTARRPSRPVPSHPVRPVPSRRRGPGARWGPGLGGARGLAAPSVQRRRGRPGRRRYLGLLPFQWTPWRKPRTGGAQSSGAQSRSPSSGAGRMAPPAAGGGGGPRAGRPGGARHGPARPDNFGPIPPRRRPATSPTAINPWRAAPAPTGTGIEIGTGTETGNSPPAGTAGIQRHQDRNQQPRPSPAPPGTANIHRHRD